MSSFFPKYNDFDDERGPNDTNLKDDKRAEGLVVIPPFDYDAAIAKLAAFSGTSPQSAREAA